MHQVFQVSNFLICSKFMFKGFSVMFKFIVCGCNNVQVSKVFQVCAQDVLVSIVLQVVHVQISTISNDVFKFPVSFLVSCFCYANVTQGFQHQQVSEHVSFQQFIRGFQVCDVCGGCGCVVGQQTNNVSINSKFMLHRWVKTHYKGATWALLRHVCTVYFYKTCCI